MSFSVPYSDDTIRISDRVLPGNSTANDPVTFQVAPAWGADLARIKSILVACSGLSDDDWPPAMQEMVIKAFETGGPAFVNTVLSITGLTVPMAMAVRAGILPAIPKGMDPTDKFPVTSGLDFGKVCGHTALLGITLEVAMAITKLSAQQQVDPRLFMRPSGSTGPATAAARTTTVGSVRRTPRRRATAAKPAQTDNPPAGTSDPSGS